METWDQTFYLQLHMRLRDAGVQPQQDPGGTLRMKGVGDRERRHVRPALIGPNLCFTFLTTRVIPFHRTFSRYKMLTHDYTGLALHHFDF